MKSVMAAKGNVISGDVTGGGIIIDMWRKRSNQ